MTVAVGLACEQSVEAAPALVLSPESGPAPAQSGSLSGSGWECSPGVVYGGALTVSGRGVSGAASIGRTGVLDGEFTVTGAPGDEVSVTVQADESCPTIGPPIYLQASAVFRFDGEPTPAPTATRTRTPTPAPSPTPPPSTNTPPPQATATQPPRATATAPTQPSATRPSGASPTPPPAGETPAGTMTAVPQPQPPSNINTVTFAGCVPGGPVMLEFVPLNLLGGPPIPDGPGMMVPAKPVDGATSMFVFDPPASEPGRIFRVTPKAGDAGCVLPEDEIEDYWIAGLEIILPMDIPGSTQLHVCTIGDKSPCALPEVKGARIARGEPASFPASSVMAADAWDVEKQFYGEDLTKGLSRFRSKVDNADAKAAKLQASLLPFAKDGTQDPPGIVASWDIGCVNCEFTVDLSALAPKEDPKKKSFLKKTWDVTTKPFTLAVDAVQWFGGVLGLGGGGDDDKVVEATKTTQNATLPGEYVVSAAPVLAPPQKFYFRLLPLAAPAGDAKGPPSNAVKFSRIDKPADIKISNTPTSVPVESAYEVKIIAYHGIIPPIVGNDTCYIVTEDAWPADFYGFNYTTDPSKAVSSGMPAVKKGHPICPPKPKEPDIFETILSWAEEGINWASGAWDDLKDFAVDIVLKYTPLGLSCSAAEGAGAIPAGACASAFAIALDAALVALGIPPDIPNFDELMDQGLEYLAAEMAAQIAIPPDVVKAAVAQGGPYAGLALSVAEAKLREELQKELEANLGDAATSIGLGYAAAVAWVPDGIPVRPDDYQPPGATVRVTRKAGVPGGDAGCTLSIGDSLTFTKEQVQNPNPAWANTINNLKPKLDQITYYNLFTDEAYGADKVLHVPPLDPGESHVIPMTFKPAYYKSGWSPIGTIPTTDYIYVWRYMHDFGMLHLSAYGCGSDKLDVPAKASVAGMQVVP